MNKKGFLLIDSLLCVVIISNLALLIYGCLCSIDNYEDGYFNYVEQSNENLENIFNELEVCYGCLINESD